MKKKKKGIGGRIPLEKEELRKPYKIYLNEKESKILIEQQEMLGYKNLSQYMRYKLLKDKERMIYVNPVELIKEMDIYGVEMGRIGSNINQMSRHADQLSKEDELDIDVLEGFTKAIEKYNDLRSKILKSFNKILSDK